MKPQEQITLGNALSDFYTKYQIKNDGGINDPVVKVELLKGFSVYIPNIESRKKVLIRHDMHHVLTGFPAVMKGEMEISAWEIATGCLHNWVAFVLNYFGMLMGILFNPIGVWRAYLLGRNTKNLYGFGLTDEALLSRPLNDLKAELGLSDRQNFERVKLSTILGFIGIIFTGFIAAIVSIPLFVLILLYSLIISVTQPGK